MANSEYYLEIYRFHRMYTYMQDYLLYYDKLNFMVLFKGIGIKPYININIILTKLLSTYTHVSGLLRS